MLLRTMLEQWSEAVAHHRKSKSRREAPAEMALYPRKSFIQRSTCGQLWVLCRQWSNLFDSDTYEAFERECIVHTWTKLEMQKILRCIFGYRALPERKSRSERKKCAKKSANARRVARSRNGTFAASNKPNRELPVFDLD